MYTGMRRESENWFKQAKEDFDSGKYNLEGKKYYLVVYLCHQTIEKSLKAIILEKSKQKTIEIHSLVQLGKLAKVPEYFFSNLRKLSPQYTISRYPDVSDEVPYLLYDENIAKEFLSFAKEILEWTEKQLKS